MSLQNDIETLYVAGLEKYAAEQHIRLEQANRIFVDHFVHENMLSQHEYLHQIPIEEVYEYILELLNRKMTDLSLNNQISFHTQKGLEALQPNGRQIYE